MNVSLATAQADYPDAWASINSQMQQVERMTDANMIPMSARLIEQDAIESLELMVMTDLTTEDSDVSATRIAFSSPLAPRPALRIVK